MMRLLVSVFLTGCAAGHCRSEYLDSQERQIASEEQLRSAFQETQETAEARLFVFKPDGSKQCNKGKDLTPQAMSKQLGSVRVFSSRKGVDGKIHPFVCDAATGNINIYEIREVDWPQAHQKGFQRLQENAP